MKQLCSGSIIEIVEYPSEADKTAVSAFIYIDELLRPPVRADYGFSQNTQDTCRGRSIGPQCHPERSKGSVALGVVRLRCAQQDRAVTHANACINLYMCMIVPTAA
jgi:hypothetical protein